MLCYIRGEVIFISLRNLQNLNYNFPDHFTGKTRASSKAALYFIVEMLIYVAEYIVSYTQINKSQQISVTIEIYTLKVIEISFFPLEVKKDNKKEHWIWGWGQEDPEKKKQE